MIGKVISTVRRYPWLHSSRQMQSKMPESIINLPTPVINRWEDVQIEIT